MLLPTSLRLLAAALAATMLLAAPASAATQRHNERVAPRDHRAALARVAQAPCANADAVPSAANLKAIRAAIVCLHNRIRAQRGLPTLRQHARLAVAARGHSADMVARGYFDHVAPGGTTMVDRIVASRYVRRNQGWSLGENLAWGTGSRSTPQGIMDAWMNSPGHRANILRRSYREFGLGIVLGVPSNRAAGATYTVEFGVRR